MWKCIGMWAHLNVVGMAGTIGVAVVTVLRLVFDVRHIDGDAARLLLGRVVDFGVALVLGQLTVGQDARDGRRQCGFAVIDVTDGADIAMRLGALEHLLFGGIESSRHAHRHDGQRRCRFGQQLADHLFAYCVAWELRRSWKTMNWVNSIE